MNSHQKIFALYKQWLSHETFFSEITINHYQRIVGNFLKYLGAIKLLRLNDVNEAIVKQFAYYNAEKKQYSPAFIKLRLAALNAFFSWTYEKGYSRENPIILYKRSQIQQKPLMEGERERNHAHGSEQKLDAVILKLNEQALIYNHDAAGDFLATRNKCIATLILDTAIFGEETIMLPDTAINLKKWELAVEGEAERRRKVPLASIRCREACKAWMDMRKKVLKNNPLPWLFFSQQLSPLTRRSLYQNVADYFETVGVYTKQKGHEVLRQTAIINMLAHYPIESVKNFTGLKTTQQLEKYQALLERAG